MNEGFFIIGMFKFRFIFYVEFYLKKIYEENKTKKKNAKYTYKSLYPGITRYKDTSLPFSLNIYYKCIT